MGFMLEQSDSPLHRAAFRHKDVGRIGCGARLREYLKELKV